MPTATRKATANAGSARKAVAGAQPASQPSASNGTGRSKLIRGAQLGAVAGRGRKPNQVPDWLVEELEATRNGEGLGEYSGDQNACQRHMALIRKWCSQETDAGRPTTPSFRTVAGNFKSKHPKTGDVTEASDEITIRYAAVRDEAVSTSK